MPRGIYDRSKMKKNKTEAKAETSAAPKGKPGRKPGPKAIAKAAKEAHKASTPVLGGQGQAEAAFAASFNTIQNMEQVRQNLITLSALNKDFGSKVPDIANEIEEHVKILGQLSRKAFGDVGTEKVVETATTSNGTTGVQFPSTVPMPPGPVPTIGH